MIAYEERVRLPRFLSPLRAFGHIVGTLLAAGIFYWSEFSGRNLGFRSWPVFIPAAYVALDFLPVLKILNGAFFPELWIQIDETTLRLKRGLIKNRIPLDSVVEISAVTAERVKRTTVLQALYQNSNFLFLERNNSSNVKLLL